MTDDSAIKRKRGLVQSHRDLEIYQRAFEAASTVFEATHRFPREEVYGLTSQIRRSSRSVAANLAEAWRKRRYEASFISKLSDAEAEAAETQVHIEFAVRCKYITPEDGEAMHSTYERLIRALVGMAQHSRKWCAPASRPRRTPE